MKKQKRQRLQSKGWKVGSVDEFLGLSKEEADFIRLKLALARYLKAKRLQKKYSQRNLAQQIHSSQSRVAKMEKGDPSVSIDLLIHSLLILGTTRKELARIINSSAQ